MAFRGGDGGAEACFGLKPIVQVMTDLTATLDIEVISILTDVVLGGNDG